MTPPTDVFGHRFEIASNPMLKQLPPHRHDYFQALWLNGNCEYFSDSEFYTIRSPTLLFVTPGQIHFGRPERGLHGWKLGFAREFFDLHAAPPSPLLHFPFWFPSDCPPLCQVPDEFVPEFDRLWEEIDRELRMQAEGFEMSIRALLWVLFVRASRFFARAGSEKSFQRSSALVREFRMLLEQNFRKATSVSSYAKMLNVSPDHLSELTKAYTGNSASELVRQRLLLEAERLLIHTEMTVSEVAFALNYQDRAYFSRFFRRMTDLTPMEFRDSFRERYRV